MIVCRNCGRPVRSDNPYRLESVARFLRERCGLTGNAPFEADASREVEVPRVFEAFSAWSAAGGYPGKPDRRQLGRDLHKVIRGLSCRQSRSGGQSSRAYVGFNLSGDFSK